MGSCAEIMFSRISAKQNGIAPLPIPPYKAFCQAFSRKSRVSPCVPKLKKIMAVACCGGCFFRKNEN